MSGMTTTTVTVTKIRQDLSTGGRAAYGVLGAVVFILGLWLLVSGILHGTNGTGYFAPNFLQWLVIVALVVVGLINIVSGAIRAEGDSSALRAIRFVIGAIVIALAIVAIWPFATGNTINGWSGLTFLWIIVAVAFTLEGIFLILLGATPDLPGWQRGLSIVLGIIVLVFGILSWAYPSFATFVVWSIFSIALLAFGLRFLVIAATGIRVHKFTATSVH